MSTTELKNILKQKIDSVNDDHLLEELLSIIEVEETFNEVFQIPPEHEKLVNNGLNQIIAGETTSNQAVQRNIKKWLYK